jgi:hypothetical protein
LRSEVGLHFGDQGTLIALAKAIADNAEDTD